MTVFLERAVETERMSGGLHHSVWLARQPDGSAVVVKATPDAPAGMFAAEAEGLAVLAGTGAVAAPEVLAVSDEHLVLEYLRPCPPADDQAFWAEAGRAVARLHAVGNDRFGWHRDNWLGPSVQYNPWTEDCYEFFAANRILRYLTEPRTGAALDAAARAGVERICARLPELVPPAPPVLTHGDLWPGNIVSTVDGRLALIDPAVSWSLAGADVGMMRYTGVPVPDVFFAAYHELRPPEPGWRDHYLVLHLRELLCMLSQGFDYKVPDVLDVIAKYA